MLRMVLCGPARFLTVPLLTMLGAASAAADGIPVTGIDVPELAALDQTVLQVMEAENASAATVAVMRHGVPIYHKAFGWKDQARNEPLQLDAMMRLASVTKPLTAAAVRSLMDTGRPGSISLNAQVFDTTGQGQGLLPHTPFGTPDPRVNDITVDHLLRHRGGWDRGIAGDHTYREVEIAGDMGIDSPPGRDPMLRWILGQPLQFDPGTQGAYSNIGFMSLGLITEQITGKPHIDVIRDNVLAPIGVDSDLILAGTTFQENHDPREPWYDHDGDFDRNVYWPDHSNDAWVPGPYGGFDVDARIGQGSVVANPLALLEFLDNYQVAGSNIGGPRPGPGNWQWTHSGAYDGTSTYASQRGDGINFVILFNKRGVAGDVNSAFNSIFNSGQITRWPTRDVTLTGPDLPGDFNLDQVVDSVDYAIWRQSLGHRVEVWTGADATGDGLVTQEDFEVWRSAYGATSRTRPGVRSSVPEPTGIALLLAIALGAAGGAGRRV